MTVDMHLVRSRLTELTLSPTFATFRDESLLEDWLKELPESTMEEIGRSRADRPIFGFTFGTGPRIITIVAGSHPDEPAGPMTAQALPLLLQEYAPELLSAYHFRVVSQINPDGAARNAPWFSDPPDLASYIQHVYRELPGEDVEFGFGSDAVSRPECNAARRFIEASGPISAHFSLHGMGFSSGAWFLINREWSTRCAALIVALTKWSLEHGWGLLDIDRGGEKGFFHIAAGFNTTPRSDAMREHFLNLGDEETAEKFFPTSMEIAMASGGDPLCMVSELPLFLIDSARQVHDFKAQLEILREALQQGKENTLSELQEQFGIEDVPFTRQIEAQFAMIVNALCFLLEHLRPGNSRA